MNTPCLYPILKIMQVIPGLLFVTYFIHVKGRSQIT